MNEMILCVHPTMTAIVGRPLRVWHVENASVAFGNVLDFFFLAWFSSSGITGL